MIKLITNTHIAWYTFLIMHLNSKLLKGIRLLSFTISYLTILGDRTFITILSIHMHTKSWGLKYGWRNYYPFPLSTYSLSISKPLHAWLPLALVMLPSQLVSYQKPHNPYTNLFIPYLLSQLLFTLLLVTSNSIINIFNHVSPSLVM